MLAIGAFEAIIHGSPTLDHVGHAVTAACEPVGLEQHPSAALRPVRAHVGHVVVAFARERFERGTIERSEVARALTSREYIPVAILLHAHRAIDRDDFRMA